MTHDAEQRSVRLDKWLWAARFFKTRSLAAEAVSGGKVHLNASRVKPARAVKCDDRLEIRRGEEVFHVIVRAISDRRGPASTARQLYEETAESLAAREHEAEQRRLFRQTAPVPPSGRPSKRDRRHIIRFQRQERNSSSDSSNE